MGGGWGDLSGGMRVSSVQWTGKNKQ